MENIEIQTNVTTVNNQNESTDNGVVVNNQKPTNDVNNTQNSTANASTSNKKESGYFGYYIFVFISAIIGFAITFFVTRVFIIDLLKTKFGVDLVSQKNIFAVIVSLVAVILFMFISLGLKKIFKKIFLSEVFLYIYIGFMTTMINIISFKLLNDKFNPGGEENSLGWMVAEVLAFVIAVTFSFFADKLVVFKSYSFVPTKVFAELGLFISARLFTEGINMIIMYVIINVLKNDPMVGKIAACVVVIVLNYLFSKFIIFKKKKKVVEHNVKEVEEVIESEIDKDKAICESNERVV